MSVSDSAAFASLASTASNYLVWHIMSIICDVWSALPRQPCPPAPPPLTAVAHWSIRNLFEVWKRSANSWNWNWSWCSGCGWGWGCRDEDDEPKRVVSSLCSFFGCALLRKCLPTFGFIINFKKLLMAATRCPKMAPPPHSLTMATTDTQICVCVTRTVCLLTPPPLPLSLLSWLILETANWLANVHDSLWFEVDPFAKSPSKSLLRWRINNALSVSGSFKVCSLRPPAQPLFALASTRPKRVDWFVQFDVCFAAQKQRQKY